MIGRPAEDLTGQTFGRWTVEARALRKPKVGSYSLWECRCECGRVGTVARMSLIRGFSMSCGCYARELYREQVEYRMSRHLTLNAGEISALLQAADHSGEGVAFDLNTEDGTKNFARYTTAIMKLRAKHQRHEKARSRRALSAVQAVQEEA